MLLPRILYGLHESFVLFSYERGSRRSKLVVRSSTLRRILLSGELRSKPLLVGAPLIVGEIKDCPYENLVPVLCNGYALEAMKKKGVEWHFRYHRIKPFAGGRSIRFESGTKMVYGTHTEYFAVELLRGLVEGSLHEPNPRARVP